MSKLTLKPVFIKTKNVRNFEVMMDSLEMAKGEGCLAVVYGQAGRGKTRTTHWYMANNGCIYLRIATIWSHSELEFLIALCRELGSISPPKRKGPCFNKIVELLTSDPRPVFLDEIEKMPPNFLDIIRDISDITSAPFILVGERELKQYVQNSRRGWSRVFQQMEFLPNNESDIIVFAKESAGLAINPEGAALIQHDADGDFRIIKRTLLNLVKVANAKQTTEITDDLIKIAIKAGLYGR